MCQFLFATPTRRTSIATVIWTLPHFAAQRCIILRQANSKSPIIVVRNEECHSQDQQESEKTGLSTIAKLLRRCLVSEI